LKTEKLSPFFLRSVICSIAFGGLWSCDQQHNPTSTFVGPNVINTKGSVISTDTMPSPEVLPLGTQKEVPVGKPAVIPMKERTKPASVTVVTAGVPTVAVPGRDSFLLPKVVAATPKVVPAGLPQVVPAQPAYTKDYNPYNFTVFGLLQGLVESQIHTIYQDRAGNIWFGTFNGISKYNGKTFENFTGQQGMLDNFTECIIQDKAGNMWFGFRGGVSKYDGHTFTNYTVNEGLSNNYITKILEDSQGNMWFTTRERGVSKLDKTKKTFTHFTEKEGLANSVLSVMEDRKGTIWFGTQNRGLVKYDGKSLTRYTQKEGLFDNTILGLLEDKAGAVWLATWSGVTKFDGHHFHHITSLAYGWASGIVEDKSGDIWFSLLPGGVCRLDKTGQFITKFTTDEGLADNEVITLLEDKIGNIWFGTNKGAVKYSRMFRTLTQPDGLVSNNVRCVLEDHQRNLWVGTETGGGVSYLDFAKNTISNFTPKEGLSDGNVISVLEDKAGNVWFGSLYGALVRLSAGGKTFTHFTDSGLFITCIFLDKAGTIWYSSRDKGGVFRLDLNTNTRTHYTVRQGLAHDQVIRIFQDKAGNMWFGTFGGVSRLDKDGKTFTNYTEKEGLNLGIVESIIEDQRGDFWFSTLGDGISRLDVQKHTYMNFTEREGLSNNTVFGMLEDRAGNLWISSRMGLNKLSKATLEALDTDLTSLPAVLFKKYTPENGYSGFGEGRYYLMEDQKGLIWIPMMDRLTVFDPKEDRTEADAPMVQLTHVNLFNEPIVWKKDSSFVLKNGIRVGDFDFDRLSQNYNIPEGLSLPYNNNFITFDFVGINTHTPKAVRYQYRLEGLDAGWSALTSRSEAAYGSLPSGNYTFKLKAMNGEGRWSNELRYDFRIRPPWWKTWWCYLLYLLLIGGVVYAFIQYRVAQRVGRIKALEAIRTKISGDLHDDVGTILSGLAMQSQMMALTAKEEQKESLNELSSMSQDAMERMRDTVWAIDSRKDKYENLIDRMRDFAERNLNRRHITHDFKAEPEDGKKFIDPQKRQNIYLIFKEAITNIVKHSDAGYVHIVFSEQKNQLYLLIHDNGSKVKNTMSSDGLGLSNMQMRAAQLGGQLTARYDNGFKVELRLG
jgi:ligand-binding sensor domain-containing protein/signal transduction histidine kinase